MTDTSYKSIISYSKTEFENWNASGKNVRTFYVHNSKIYGDATWSKYLRLDNAAGAGKILLCEAFTSLNSMPGGVTHAANSLLPAGFNVLLADGSGIWVNNKGGRYANTLTWPVYHTNADSQAVIWTLDSNSIK